MRMDKDNKTGIGTVRELAEYITENITDEDIRLKRFRDVDFAVIDREFTDKELTDLSYVKSGTCGWHGIHNVDCGFDGYEMTLVGDYYGWGAMRFINIDRDSSKKQIIADILSLMLGCLNTLELGIKPSALIVFEFEDGVNNE